MRIAFVFFIFSITFACGQSKKEISIKFQPKDSMVYSYDMITEELTISGVFNTQFSIKNDSVIVDVEVANLSGKSKAIADLGYETIIGETYTRYYDIYGKAIDLKNLSKQALNTDMLIVEFPKTPIKVGTKWDSKKTAKPEIFFDEINVKYTCSSIDDYFIAIEAEMNYITKDDYFANTIKISRTLIGKYIVDRKDGSVVSANLDMDLFTGFSRFKGTVDIKKLQNKKEAQ